MAVINKDVTAVFDVVFHNIFVGGIFAVVSADECAESSVFYNLRKRLCERSIAFLFGEKIDLFGDKLHQLTLVVI